MAGKTRAFEPAQSIEVDGNKGGSYIRIARTSKEDVVRLAVGHDCVTSCDIEISVFALAAILTQVADVGFRKMVADHYSYQNGEIPTWAEPIPAEKFS